MCYIRLNNEEIREQLEKLGYKYSGFDDISNNNICLTPCSQDYSCICDSLINSDDPYTSWSINREDCGTDVDKFLKLAKEKLYDNNKRVSDKI